MLSLNEEKQQEVLREVLKKKLTVADTERLIKKEPKPKKKKASADVKKINFKKCENCFKYITTSNWND